MTAGVRRFTRVHGKFGRRRTEDQPASTRVDAGQAEHIANERGLLRPDAAVAMRCAVIDAEKANYPIAWMCRQLGVPRSSFYAWRTRPST